MVGAYTAAGQPRGLTLSAFASVSLQPPLILICVDHESNTLPAIEGSRRFTVNILAQGAERIATRFASKDPNKFEDIPIEEDPVGAGPILPNHICAYASCRVENQVDAGDHRVYIAEIDDGRTYPGRQPLIHHNKTVTPLPKRR